MGRFARVELALGLVDREGADLRIRSEQLLARLQVVGVDRPPFGGHLVVGTAKKKKAKVEDEGSLRNLSQRGCRSFGSMKSYILGDLDLSSDDADLHSFEISSNSSQAKSIGEDII